MIFTKPTMLVDPDTAKKNLKDMCQKARRHKLMFRPHFKTHQSGMIGAWYSELGIDKITVSSVDMAAYFTRFGWEDILIAFPVNIKEIDVINKLAQQIKLSLTVLNVESVEYLDKYLLHEVDVYIKIDAGYKRTGVVWSNQAELQSLAHSVNENEKLNLKGILCHSGQTYQVNSVSEIIDIHEESKYRMKKVEETLSSIKKDLLISIGDTPSCSLADDFEGVDEIRPGNFIFYDLQQYRAGACNLSDIAISVACPIVSMHRDRNEMVIYGGAVHFSKDTFFEGGRNIYGYVVSLSDEGWIVPDSKMLLTKVSQEHGIISVSPDAFMEYKTGDFIGVLPAHACLTANLMKGYVDSNGIKYDHLACK